MNRDPSAIGPSLVVLDMHRDDRAGPDVRSNRRKLRGLLRRDPAALSTVERAFRVAAIREGRGTSNAWANVLIGKLEGPQHRSLIIKPVGDGCNYRCDYCFHHDVLERIDPMPLGSVERIFRDAAAALGDRVDFIWHGGEPTLAGLPYFEEAIRLQRIVFGKRMNNAIQTNGSRLTPEWISFLKKEEFSIGISVDGDRISHDLHRKSAAGRGTFERTLRAMEALRDARCAYAVIAVITAGGADASELYRLVAEAGATHISTNPAAVSEGSGLGPTAEEYGAYVISLLESWMERGGEGPFVVEAANFIGGLIGGWQPVCYLNGSCSTYLTIENNGQLKGCCDRNTGATTHPETYLGDVFTEGLDRVLGGESSRKFAAAADANPVTCQGCQWLPMCRGGCSHQRLIGGGALDAHDPSCASYKMIFRFLQESIDGLPIGD